MLSGIVSLTRKALGERRPLPRQTASDTSDSVYGSPPPKSLVPGHFADIPENVIQIRPELFKLCC